jgi:hypothetical protein
MTPGTEVNERIVTRRGAPYEYYDSTTGRDLFSVTQIRKVIYDPYKDLDLRILEAARRRGSILHHRFFLAVAHASGDWDAYPERIEEFGGYCDSMDRWIEAVRPKAIRLEEKGWHLERGFAGQVDGLMTLTRHRYSGLSVGDCKTGMVNPTDKVQVTAYSHMELFKSHHQFLVYFDADGGQAKEVWVDPGERGVHWAAFLSAMSVLRWRMRFAKV